MKRMVFFMMLIYMLFFGYAQRGDVYESSNMDKFIKMAFENGEDSNGMFCLINNSKKEIDVSHCANYLRYMGYYPVESTEQEYRYYSPGIKVVDKMWFTNDANAYKNYVFNKLKGDEYKYVGFGQLKRSCIFFYSGYKDYGLLGWENSKFEDNNRIDDVRWSGNVVDGLLDGEGVGVYEVGQDIGVFKGEFLMGIPKTQITVTKFDGNTIVLGGYRNSKNNKEEVETIKKKLIFDSWKSVSSPLLKKALKANISQYYAKDYVDIQDEYNNALALNEGKYNRYYHHYNEKQRDLLYISIENEYRLYQGFKNENKYSKLLTIRNVENMLNEFIKLYEGKDVDSLNMLPKAKELLELYKVLEVRCTDFHIQGDYLTHNLGNYIKFNEKRVDSEIDSYFDALKIVRENSKSPSSSFMSFYKAVCPEFVAKEDFYRYEYKEQAYSAFCKAKVEELTEKCEKCKIEGGKTTFPKGYVEEYKGLFFNTPAQSEHEGTIRLRNGEYITWKYIYGDRKTTIMTSGIGFQGEYNSVAEMMDGIISNCRKKFCR